MKDDSMPQQELLTLGDDPVFMDIFLPLYRNYKSLDREFDKKVIKKDIDNLRRKFDMIAKAKERRKTKA